MAKDPFSKEQALHDLEILKQRYANKQVLPKGVAELTQENPDLPIRKLNKFLRDSGEIKAENYYIRNHILQGKPTDRQEFTLYEVRFLSSGRVFWVFSKIQDLYEGDSVMVSYWESMEKATILRIVTCFGIDAPYPVTGICHRICKRLESSPEVLKAGGNPPTAALSKMAASAKFPVLSSCANRFTPVMDLTETDSKNLPRFDIVQLRFRGVVSEIQKLWTYLDANGCTSYMCTAVDKHIAQLVINSAALPGDGTPNLYARLIGLFPALKATGLVEDWKNIRVLAIYSESGADCVNKWHYCSLFDPKDDGGDSRWAHTIDMMEPHRARFIHTRTSEEDVVDYRYPWKEAWADNQYFRSDAT